MTNGYRMRRRLGLVFRYWWIQKIVQISGPPGKLMLSKYSNFYSAHEIPRPTHLDMLVTGAANPTGIWKYNLGVVGRTKIWGSSTHKGRNIVSRKSPFGLFNMNAHNFLLVDHDRGCDWSVSKRADQNAEFLTEQVEVHTTRGQSDVGRGWASTLCGIRYRTTRTTFGDDTLQTLLELGDHQIVGWQWSRRTLWGRLHPSCCMTGVTQYWRQQMCMESVGVERSPTPASAWRPVGGGRIWDARRRRGRSPGRLSNHTDDVRWRRATLNIRGITQTPCMCCQVLNILIDNKIHTAWQRTSTVMLPMIARWWPSSVSSAICLMCSSDLPKNCWHAACNMSSFWPCIFTCSV